MKFCLVAHPMIEGFVLPEGSPSAIKNLICHTGAGAFDGSGDLAQSFVWVDQDVNVVRHDDPGIKIVELPLLGCKEESFDYCVGDLWMLEPHWAGGVV